MWAGVKQVVHDSRIKQNCVLWHNTNVLAEAIKRHISEIMTVNGDGTVRNIVETEEKLETSRLAATRLSHDGRLGARSDSEADVVDHGLALVALVGKLDVVKGNLSSWRGHLNRILLFHDARRLLELAIVSNRDNHPPNINKDVQYQAGVRPR